LARPLVSVLIDTYNHERFIEQAVASVLQQDFPSPEREILVVDDGSTDRTPEILQKFATEVKILRKVNGGQASAFNLGISECRGEFVAFLDGDDWWTPHKLARVAESLASDPHVGIVGHGIIEAYEDGRLHTELVREEARFRLNSTTAANLFRQRKSFLGTSRMAFRSSLLREIGSVPEALVIEADEYLFTLGPALSDALILREPLTYYRLHAGNAFKSSDGNIAGLRRKQHVLETLYSALREKFPALSVPPAVGAIVLASVRVDSEVIRLSLENGLPWETLGVELSEFRVNYRNASLSQRLIKLLGLLPALFLPSRFYYSCRQRLTALGLYRELREKWVPFPEPDHVDRYRATRS
jgi:glycosyltransferase involved in cell wall biosynthesis